MQSAEKVKSNRMTGAQPCPKFKSEKGIYPAYHVLMVLEPGMELTYVFLYHQLL